MNRERTSSVGEWWKIFEIPHPQRNSKIIWFFERGEEHRRWVNDEISLKFIMMREILKRFHCDEWRKGSDFGQRWNMLEIHHHEGNSKMISFWWRQKQHRTFLNDKALFKFVMMGELLTWCHFYQEEKRIARSWMLKYCWNCLWSEKFENDLILMGRKRRSEVGHRSSSVELHHGQRNSKMISFSWTEEEYQKLGNDEILLQFIILREILKSSHFAE